MKQLALIIFGILISIVIFSCKKEASTLNNFNVSIKNDYFENIDSTNIGNTFFGQILPTKQTQQISIPKGDYVFICYTKSQLEISANISLNGTKESLLIIINNSGSVLLN